VPDVEPVLVDRHADHARARLAWALERPAYNLVLHTAPFDAAADAAFHWRLDILPRVTRFSGREWASGMYRNPVAPEEAARVLRRTAGSGV
jgi:UDPglucose--hexose-1-phosphate uridylyltransferase